jgi:hypothetical protein
MEIQIVVGKVDGYVKIGALMLCDFGVIRVGARRHIKNLDVISQLLSAVTQVANVKTECLKIVLASLND